MNNNKYPRVFLCHASKDKPKVRILFDRLETEGIDVWLDEEKLLPGQDWQLEIPKAVRNSDIVIILLSKNSVNKEGYIQKEIRIALDIADEKPDGTIFLIPVVLEKCQIPERLKKWQYVNLYDENGYQKLVLSLNARFSQLKKVRKEAKGETGLTEYRYDLDKTDFPMIWIPNIQAFCHWLPVTKIQIEIYFADLAGVLENANNIYSEIIKINPRVAPSRITKDNFKGVFATGLTPFEIAEFVNWFGSGYSIPTIDEMRLISKSLLASPAQKIETVLEQTAIHSREKTLLFNLNKVLLAINQTTTQESLADQMLINSKISEWVMTKRNSWIGTQSGLVEFKEGSRMENISKIRKLDYGFRLLKRVSTL